MLNPLNKTFHLECHVPKVASLTAAILEVKITRTTLTDKIVAEPGAADLEGIVGMPNSYNFLKLLFTRSLLFVLCCSAASAQDTTAIFNRMMANSGALYYSHPVEKVYLHFDKPYYAVGDTIWFKAYLTVNNHMPSTLSKIVYVDVISPRDSLMQSLKLPVTNGVAWSFIPVSQYNYKKGNYRIVAYTNWMNNADLGYFFNKTITIGDAINNNLSTNISLQSTIENETAKISAGIFYKNDSGVPYGGKRVNWSAQNGKETIARGKVVTDKYGFAGISFVNLKNADLDSANLVTTIDVGSYNNVTSTFPLKPVSAPNDVQFFPEGGTLLAGVQTKVAFKAIKPNGLGIDIKGVVMDNNGTIVAKFTSSHLGMGVFDFTPEAGKTYTAKINCADGSVISPQLPKVQTGGIILSLDNTDTATLWFKLKADAPFLQRYKGQIFFILAKSAGVICFAATTQLTDLVYSAGIPKSKFPTGILQVTLFTADGRPVSERIAFIQHNNPLNLAISADKPSYATRQQVKLNISAQHNHQPDEGNFSITVVDDAKVPYDEDAESTILTNLLLTSDIKGYIEKPNYYFNHTDEKTAADLDVLLQTQGYRRYAYDGILDAEYPPINFPAEQGIDITGAVTASKGRAVVSAAVTLTAGEKKIHADSLTDANGRFKFTNLVFTGWTKVNITAGDSLSNSHLVVTVNGSHDQRIPVNYTRADEIVNIDTVLNAYLKNSKVQFNNTHTLKEVVIKGKKYVRPPSHKDDARLATLSELRYYQLIRGDALWGWNSFLVGLRPLVNSMEFSSERQNFYVKGELNKPHPLPVQIFVGGTEVDAAYLTTLDANTVESVEVFLKDELGVVNKPNFNKGVLVINLRRIEATPISMAELKSMLPERNGIIYNVQGYTAIRSFYSPRYDAPRSQQSTTVDTRSTIYWNPNINTNKTTGTASVEYFNADGVGTYRVIIEGIDKDGNIGRQVFRYEVK